MAKPPKPGKCIHCLHYSEELNWDHVFPKSWYPDTTPPNLSKWQVPSCIRCNSELGKIECEFIVLIAMCLDPNNPASKSIVQKALRAMSPKHASTLEEKHKREGLAKKVLSRVINPEEIPSEAIYPIMKDPQQGSIAFTIPAESFRRITEKIVRGITYLDSGQLIEPPHSIEFFAVNEEASKPLRDVIDRYGTTLAREPGIIVRKAVSPEDGISALYELEFWKQFKMHAAVLDDNNLSSNSMSPN
jgi:hypothetical protein